MQGGRELYLAGTRGLKLGLMIDLEASDLTLGMGEIIQGYALSRWDEDDQFEERAKPTRPLSAEAEHVLGITNDQLAPCRPSDVVPEDYLAYLDG
jgi:DNA polymerase III epsilon subunit-like protein